MKPYNWERLGVRLNERGQIIPTKKALDLVESEEPERSAAERYRLAQARTVVIAVDALRATREKIET